MLINEIRKNMLKQEQFYSKYATFDCDAIRFKTIKEDIRPNYFRDIDRIIHSLAYTRYTDKTQVFSHLDNDHITKRIIHVSLVSKIARTIGRALNLNEDLIEAGALGHDLGHTPFGHVGEKILNDLSLKHNQGYFNHNVQSVRILMDIEEKNLTLQVLDTILCHNGEVLLNKYTTTLKTKEEFLEEIKKTYLEENFSQKLKPLTLEGCVVRISDIIAYIGRDLEDAFEIGLITKEQVPTSITKVIGNSNTEIINAIINDLITNSYGKPYLQFSENVWQAIEELKAFNYKNIYNKANSKEDIETYKIMFEKLFAYYLENYNNKNINFYKHFLGKMNKNYLENNSIERKIIDYLAGMTDDYFLNEYLNIISN